MNDTNFQDLYYKLATEELKRLLQITTLEQADRDTVNEYISQNELGLAFEAINSAPAAADSSDEFEAQVAILSGILG